MKLGICTGIGYDIPFDERMRLIKEAGFDIVSLDFEADMEPTETTWDNQVRVAEKYGLPIDAVHLTGTQMTGVWTDGEVAEYVTERLINELRHMSEVGVGIGVAHVTWGFDCPPPPSQSALDRYLRVTEAAEKYNVKLALENSVFPEHVHYLLEHIDSSHVGFCYDSGHENAFTPQENYLARYGDRLFTMHLHDNYGNFDQHDIPFRGTVDWKTKIPLIRKSAIGDRLILELGRQPEPFEQIIPMAYEAMRHLTEL